MPVNPMDVLAQFPVRKTSKQKNAFRTAIIPYLESLGYSVTLEKGTLGATNVIIGDPETAKYLVTAHYDTCARMLLPNFITPCNVWIYWGYQLLLVVLFMVISAIGGLAIGALNDAMTLRAAMLVFWLILVMMLLGPANPTNANDNTSGVIALLEIARTLPENQRHKVCFVLFDLEEAGLIGSGSYRKKHKKATEHQLILNLDCVGDGDHIRMFPTKKLRKDRKKCTALYKACGYFGSKDLLVHEKGLYIYPSDQKRFPYAVGICALCKGKLGLYTSKIHTPKDTQLDHNNINILRAALTSFICCDEVY